MGDFGGVLLAVVLLAANAFFVGAEFALISARRSQIEPRAQAGSRTARITVAAMERVSEMMAGAQLGITICSLGLGAVGEPALAHLVEPVFHELHVPEDWLHPVAFVLAMTIVVFLHVVLGEMVPKNIAIAGPDRAALILGPPMYGIVTVLRPVIIMINALANAILRLLRIEPKDEIGSTYTREEVAALVEESHGEGLLAEDEYDRLSGALGFTEKTVAEVMMRPDSLATVVRGSTGADVEALCAATGFSRFPVVSAAEGDASDGGDGGGAPIDLIGYLHIKDVLEPDEERRERPVADRWIRPFATVTDDTLLHDALEVLQRRGAHMARVVDPAGTTLGVAALEDVIEELVGEIRDAAHSEESSAP
ncbi:hemolysin family protein [Nocardioides daeguensis]|uniref:Hemolysin family protein n=1 Tax=Nocardioides daeguensis TaxID=908359 RepID=A0ABP6V5G0_9ACTN|nr:hemolysin family protein [Nocardioides daeguensis]MBV6729701.1 hemolysin family protein [Nocardioides daeguensis]MCR1774694.1 hemolysin family protein [Nocardioides daeguensis]